MRINILAASDGTPLTKTYTQDGAEVITTPYPFVKLFDSFSYDVFKPSQFRDVLVDHAAQGHCLLKGALDRELSNESRAGHTSTLAPTAWLGLDLDFDTGFPSIEAFLAALDPSLAECSYIKHHSASAGIKRAVGLSVHLYIMTRQEHLPELLKLWLIHKNLTVPELRKQIKLAKNGLSLVYPLDITTCQNDKLLFIPDPICNGLDDPMAGQRFELVEKDVDLAELVLPQLNPQVLRDQQDDLVAELRAAAGLKKRKAKYANHGAIEILANPDQTTVTSAKEERGFVYLNLNGGDSWGYYFRPENPELLYNFKGEPVVRLADIAPAFYKEFIKDTTNLKAKHNRQPFVFRHHGSDAYWNGIYDASEDTITALYRVKSKDRMKDFMAQFGEDMPDPIEDWKLEFNPQTNKVFDAERKWVNHFAPTTYMKNQMPASPRVPTVISKVLRSICVDQETFDHFINWLAYIFQTRKKTGTAWIFHGVPGTGKGILQEKILMPLFGKKHVAKVVTQNLQDQFNGYMETALILIIDEAKLDATFMPIIDKLKNLITEDTVQIRNMHTAPYGAPNFINVIIATNHPDPIPLALSDRRFNVAPAQETPLEITPAELAMLNDELELFAGYLQNYEVDELKVIKILKNQAREQMIIASQTTVDQMFIAFRNGDLDYFTSQLRDKPSIAPNNAYIDYERAVKEWAAQAGDKQFFVPRDQLMAAYKYLVSEKMTPAKFGRMCSIQRLNNTVARVNGKLMRGFYVTMRGNDDETINNLLFDNVTDIRKFQ